MNEEEVLVPLPLGVAGEAWREGVCVVRMC